MSNWFTDSQGNKFTTGDGKPPSGNGVSVTIANGTGQLNNGRWDGSNAQPTDKGSKSSS
jgi:hypothetical protein